MENAWLIHGKSTGNTIVPKITWLTLDGSNVGNVVRIHFELFLDYVEQLVFDVTLKTA